MKRQILTLLALCAAAFSLHAQMDWKTIEKLIDDGSYKTAYAKAEGVYKSSRQGRERLLAAYYMSQAAANYQEDARDSAEARYRALLPSLTGVDKSLCHSFLGEYKSAMADEQLLRETPVEQIKAFCEPGGTMNMTPTAADVIVRMMIERGELTPQERVEWQQKLVDWHRGDGEDLRIWHDSRLLELMAQVPNRPLKFELLLQYLDKYRSAQSPLRTMLYANVAHRLNGEGEYERAGAYCDTAIALAPKSEGAVECVNLKNEILQVRIEVASEELTYAPSTKSLQRVRYRNVERLWFRIIPFVEGFEYGDKTKARLLTAKPLKEWNMTVGQPERKYDYAESYFVVPEMKAGHYLLLVSPTSDFKKEGFMAYVVNCTDMLLMQADAQGLLVDRQTGRPIVGQEIRVEERRYNEKPKVLETVKTDRDGRYRITAKVDNWRTYLVAERDGYRLETQCRRRGTVQTVKQLHCEVRTDRPIYKPGDTVRVALLAYRCDGLDAEAIDEIGLKVRLNDPNGQQVAQDSIVTDDFGMASTSFVVPKDRIAGVYQLSIRHEDAYLESTAIHVEEYKQPKFMVTINSNSGEVPMFGKEMTVKGMAASYNGVPVSGAKVKYTVHRSRMHRWWWRGYGPVEQSEVGTGEVSTAADGSFEVKFVPEPDSSVELSTKPCFEYTIEVDVTDINGESHPARTSMRVGFRNAFVSLKNMKTELRTLDGLETEYIDLNGNPLPGKVDIRIERLKQPATPLLNPLVMKAGVHNLMAETDFRKTFPLYAYNEKYNDPSTWEVAGVGYSGSGVYRITLSAADADTVVEHVTVTTEDATKIQSQELVWMDVEKNTVEVGETAKLRIGSRFKEVDVYYLLRIGNEERDFRHITVNDDLKSISIPVDSAMLGGFTVDVIAVKDGIVKHMTHQFTVPFTHKKLDVEVSTFRDKLQPGENEEWTIVVRNSGLGVRCGVIMTMYDDALNSYGYGEGWGFSPWRSNWSNSIQPVSFHNGTGWWLQSYTHRYYNGNHPSVWTLKEGLPYGNRYWGRRMYKTAAARNMVTTELAVVEDVEYEESLSLDAAPMAAGATLDKGTEKQELEPQVRTNLNTLAFFVTDLHTDDNGVATYRFTVPELLTRWNVRGLAVTHDVKIGTLDRTLVTQKRLMVQPNMPRFLRSGDSLSLMAKVVRGSEFGDLSKDLPVTVSFLLTDAATGDTICNHEEHIKLKDATQVIFDVEVPQNVYVATYRILATADGMSDGEQGQIPVVGNRQAVTVSQAMYINGVGEKHYHMPEFLAGSESRMPNLVAAEVVSNPIWLAIKVMPFLKDLENPSILYLANQLFVNSKGLELISNYDLRISEFGIQNSKLRLNEDVKLTLLQATPWVRDAESEEEQMAAVANYFDAERLQAELSKLLSRLVSLQNGDGGWSWMPEGKSSAWVTQQVLQRIAAISSFDKRSIKQSLAYVDREEQRYYERYIKPYLKKKLDCGVTDIDYLYMRSFYGKASTEAYKYYYDNALNRYKNFENLYTQAQLALIFQRHGDRKQARDLIRRLKEKSLVSDEMGMYWRDNRNSWWWYQRPIETQALIIQAFAEVTPDDTLAIGQMQQWLLKQKQTTHWGNEVATTRAIEALLSGEQRVASGEQAVEMKVFGEPLSSEARGQEGYKAQRWKGEILDSLQLHHDDEIVIRKSTPGIAWGAVYYQFTDDMDKIPSSEMGITISRTYLSSQNTPLSTLKVGDRIKVRIEISCDRTMEYLELIDGRPSCVEPLSTRAGWCYNDGLRYYVTVNNTDTRCYIDRLEKGRYVVEYEVYVTNPGTFLSGPATMQCMYAPEFRAVSPSQLLHVK